MADTLAAKLREGKEIMVKQIVRDVFFLGQKSEPAARDDLQVGRDLQDTLNANRDRCVGMAANMIGVKKNVIIINMGVIDLVMFKASPPGTSFHNTKIIPS